MQSIYVEKNQELDTHLSLVYSVCKRLNHVPYVTLFPAFRTQSFFIGPAKKQDFFPVQQTSNPFVFLPLFFLPLLLLLLHLIGLAGVPQSQVPHGFQVYPLLTHRTPLRVKAREHGVAESDTSAAESVSTREELRILKNL